MKGNRIRRGLNAKILQNTIFNILTVVLVCCVIMAYSMQSLSNDILLDNLQPMARQSAKTVEANVHMLADRMMTIAGDSRIKSVVEIGGEQIRPGSEALQLSRQAVLTEAAEVYELYHIAFYDKNGTLIQGTEAAPETLAEEFFSLLQETDNLTTDSTTVLGDKLGITMGMPVKEDGETALYVVGVFKYDVLSDVLGSINVGKHGTAWIVNREGAVVGHTDPSVVLAGNTQALFGGSGKEEFGRVTTGETGAVEFSVDGETMMTAFSPVRGTCWSLVIQMPKSDYNYLIDSAVLASIAATAAVLLLSILLVLQLARSISKPVRQVTERMVALSDGDLHTEVTPVRSRDEVEVLTHTLADTVESVNHYISDIRQVLKQVADGNLVTEPQGDYRGDFAMIKESLYDIIGFLNETILGFRGAAVRLAGMAEQLSGQSGQLHQASLEQNQSAEALVNEVSHVKEQLDNVSESTMETHTKTEEIVRCTQEANARMAALSEAMDAISTNAQEITKIAKVIDDISFQTSILALNASVEAARAGSAGQGFAVVADEVRELAAKSAEAAQHATEMVDNTRTIISNGVKLTADTAGSLQDISSVSTQISRISDRLVAAVQGQANALTVMEERIENISDIADRNLQNAGGTESASGLLAKEAEALQDQVKKFVLKEGYDR